MIESLIKTVLSDTESEYSIVDLISKYGDENVPAVFMQTALSDTTSGLYPRVDFMFDRASNDERKSEGLLVVNVWCLNTGTLPEDIEGNIRQLLNNVFIKDDGETFCFVWDRNEAFEINNDTVTDNALILGITMFFDVLAFPLGELTEPDPIAALMDYTGANYSDIQLIGDEDMESIYRATDDCPAVYYNISRIERAESWYLCQWMLATVQAHIFAASAEKRTEIVKQIADDVTHDECIRMRDGSDMRCRDTSVNMSAKAAQTGQIAFKFYYGILRNSKDTTAEKLNHAYLNSEEV